MHSVCQNVDMGQEEMDLSRTVGYLLKQVQAALRSEMDAVLGPLSLSAPQYACLELLKRNPAISNSALARGAFVSRQSMNSVLHTLRERGLVEPAASGAQGRAVPMQLTATGQDLLLKAGSAVKEIEERMISDLTDSQHAMLVDALHSCARSLGRR